MYVGNGHITEAITSGVVERNIEAYRFPRYRLGVCRPINATPDQLDRIIAFVRSQVGKKYNYRGMLRLAIIKILKIRFKYAEHSFLHPRDSGPNEIPMRPGMKLIFTI
jgi:hypothetical protein